MILRHFGADTIVFKTMHLFSYFYINIFGLIVSPFVYVASAVNRMHMRVFFFTQMVPGAGSVPAIQRIPLPGAEMLEEEPLYVNAKQYHRILKRRQARAKLEAEGKIPKERRVSI